METVPKTSRLFYQKLRDFLYHIPGDNPNQFTLCGTNCFILGKGKNRVMIEAGDYPERNGKFLENLSQFLQDFKPINLDKIFITHSHIDHFGGVSIVLETLKKYG